MRDWSFWRQVVRKRGHSPILAYTYTDHGKHIIYRKHPETASCFGDTQTTSFQITSFQTSSSQTTSFSDIQLFVTTSFCDNQLLWQPAFCDNQLLWQPAFVTTSFLWQPAFCDIQLLWQPAFCDNIVFCIGYMPQHTPKYVTKSWLSLKAGCHKSWLSQKLDVWKAGCHKKLDVWKAGCLRAGRLKAGCLGAGCLSALVLVLLVANFFFRKSNAHTLILDWCAFALDGVKNVTNEQGVSRSWISFLCR